MRDLFGLKLRHRGAYSTYIQVPGWSMVLEALLCLLNNVVLLFMIIIGASADLEGHMQGVTAIVLNLIYSPSPTGGKTSHTHNSVHQDFTCWRSKRLLESSNDNLIRPVVSLL